MGSLLQRIGDWFTSLPRVDELRRLDESEARRIATDAGVSVGDLYALHTRGGSAAMLLPRRLRRLGIDAAWLARREPETLRDMQRLCTLCQSKRRCEHDLADNSQSADWQSYCPNAATLRTLR